MSIQSFFKTVERMIHPPLPIGGLEISDTFLRFVALHDERVTTIAVRLPPGALDNGAVVSREELAIALRGLYQQLVQSNEPTNVVMTIASSHVYTQVVRLPAVPAEQYEAALDLNLRASSPLEAAKAYYDAELLGFGAGNEQEFLAAFVDRALIDALHDLLTEIGFMVIAVEFPALSTARVIAMLGRGYATHEPLLLVAIVPDGVDLMIVRDGHLLFHYWQSFRGLTAASDARAIDAAVFESVVSGALQRTLHFYTSQWSGAIGSAIVVTRGAMATVQPMLEQLELRVLPLVVDRFAEAATFFPAALGAALRGNVPRSDDVFISIAPFRTEAAFARARFWHFVTVWRSVMTTAAIGIFLLFLAADGVLAQQKTQDALRASPDAKAVALRDATALRDQAIAFNRSVDFIAAALTERGAFSPLLNELRRLAGNGVVIKRIAFQSRDRSIALTGTASSGFAAIDFKNTLARQPQFANVVLPFSRITTEGAGVSFQLTLNLQK